MSACECCSRRPPSNDPCQLCALHLLPYLILICVPLRGIGGVPLGGIASLRCCFGSEPAVLFLASPARRVAVLRLRPFRSFQPVGSFVMSAVTTLAVSIDPGDIHLLRNPSQKSLSVTQLPLANGEHRCTRQEINKGCQELLATFFRWRLLRKETRELSSLPGCMFLRCSPSSAGPTAVNLYRRTSRLGGPMNA